MEEFSLKKVYLLLSPTQKGTNYHIFNRGINNQDIFLDGKDYSFFETYLSIYLLPLPEVFKKYPDAPSRLHSKNLSSDVEILEYCLMPNHFHMFLKQKTKNGISKLMKQMTNAYTLFFNQKHNRTGSLMQGRFKAVPITETHLSDPEREFKRFHDDQENNVKEQDRIKYLTVEH